MDLAVASRLGRFYAVKPQQYLMQGFVLEPAPKLLFKLDVLLKVVLGVSIGLPER